MKKQKTIKCSYCGAHAVLQKGTYVYGDKSKEEYLYVCSNYPQCDSYVGVHAGTKKPKGTLANAELRNKRIKTHKVFDQVWKSKLMTKKEAYRWMTYVMGLPFEMGHIGSFSEYRCDELIRICKDVLANNNIELPIGA